MYGLADVGDDGDVAENDSGPSGWMELSGVNWSEDGTIIF
jgi:hypothetical protein